jgi:hypothetical protein
MQWITIVAQYRRRPKRSIRKLSTFDVTLSSRTSGAWWSFLLRNVEPCCIIFMITVCVCVAERKNIKFLKWMCTGDNACNYSNDFLYDVKYSLAVRWISLEDNFLWHDGMEISKGNWS